MSKSLLWAFFLIVLCVLFFIFTGGNTRIEIFNLTFPMKTSVALLIFTGLGTTIGVLLK